MFSPFRAGEEVDRRAYPWTVDRGPCPYQIQVTCARVALARVSRQWRVWELGRSGDKSPSVKSRRAVVGRFPRARVPGGTGR